MFQKKKAEKCKCCNKSKLYLKLSQIKSPNEGRCWISVSGFAAKKKPMLPHERCLPTLSKSPESFPPQKEKEKRKNHPENKNWSQKKHAVKTLKVSTTTTTGNSEHGHEPSSSCLELHSAAAAPPESQPKGGYLNSVTDQSPPTLCTDSSWRQKNKNQTANSSS